MLTVHSASETERLLDPLCARLAERSDDALVQQDVIVPSAGMRRYLSLEVANRLGICCNIRFPFLAHWVWEQIRALDPTIASESPFSTASLTWRILSALNDEAWLAGVSDLQRSIGGADASLKFERAVQIAELFEQYIVYRPDWLDCWARGEPARQLPHDSVQRWQMALWRRLLASMGIGEGHPLKRLMEDPLRMKTMAHRTVHAFALPSMAPLYLQFLAALGQLAEVHVYLINPSQHYWFDLVSSRRLAALEQANSTAFHESGPPLLAWAAQTQAYGRLLQEHDPQWDAYAAERPFGTQLRRLQRQLETLGEDDPGDARPDTRSDWSVLVGSCHSLTRQLEVLQDRLLACFEADPTLAPEDVLVVTPDLATTAPLIDAVFATAGERWMPYAISGVAAQENACARGLLALLDLLNEQVPVTGLIDWLHEPVISGAFDLSEDDLGQLTVWFAEAGIRRGLDEGAAEASLDAATGYSLSAGLERLYRGFALFPETSRALGANARPIRWQDGVLLGRLELIVRHLKRWHRQAKQAFAPEQWNALLLDMQATLFASRSAGSMDVAAAIDELTSQWRRAAAQTPLPLEVVTDALRLTLEQLLGAGLPTGRITFTSMSSLRGVPFRIIAAVGLDEAAFPRRDPSAEIDLMRAHPRPGDRSRRQEDRNAMLDLVLCARDRLLLFYTGRDVRDDRRLPPSVLVTELLESLAGHARDVHISYPLNRFSKSAYEHFDDLKRASYDESIAELLSRPGERRPAVPSVTKQSIHSAAMSGELPASDRNASSASRDALDDEDADVAESQPRWWLASPEPAPVPEGMAMDDFIKVIGNPARSYLRRMGVRLEHSEAELTDRVPLLADEAFVERLAHRLLEPANGTPSAQWEGLVEREIGHPVGTLGTLQVRSQLGEIARFGAQLERIHQRKAPSRTAFALALGRLTIRGELTNRFGDTLLSWRFGNARATDVLSTWVQHLIACACEPKINRSVFATPAEDWTFARVDDPLAALEAIAGWVAENQTRPIPFFAMVSRVLVEENLGSARKRWTDDRGGRIPYRDHEENALVWRGRDPLAETDFEHIAHDVYDPLYKHRVTP